MINTLKNWFYYFVGIAFLVLSFVKYYLQGYSPKPFTVAEAQRCAEYDIQIVNYWIEHLHQYTGENVNGILRNKSILELGPGSDLGVGLYLLSKSAREYNAIDIFNLIKCVPEKFYHVFFSVLHKQDIDTEPLINELDKTTKGNSEKLNYFCRKDFDIVSALESRKIDIIFSTAAFEHFNDFNKTIKDVTMVAVSGARFIVSVDLQTHSRWVREHDPNNIYRYPKWLYNILSVPVTPNRVRPYEYREALERNGWKDIRIVADTLLEEEKYSFIKKHFNKDYFEEQNQMNYLTIVIYATKS